MQKNPFTKFNTYSQLRKKNPLNKQGIEQEFLNLWVSMGLLESRSQDKIRQARNLLEEMLVRGSEQKA